MPHWESSRNEGPHEQGEKGPPWEWLRQERNMKGEVQTWGLGAKLNKFTPGTQFSISRSGKSLSGERLRKKSGKWECELMRKEEDCSAGLRVLLGLETMNLLQSLGIFPSCTGQPMKTKVASPGITIRLLNQSPIEHLGHWTKCKTLRDTKQVSDRGNRCCWPNAGHLQLADTSQVGAPGKSKSWEHIWRKTESGTLASGLWKASLRTYTGGPCIA